MPLASVDGRRGSAQLGDVDRAGGMEDSNPRKFKARTFLLLSRTRMPHIGALARRAGLLGRGERGREINAKQSSPRALTLNLQTYSKP